MGSYFNSNISSYIEQYNQYCTRLYEITKYCKTMFSIALVTISGHFCLCCDFERNIKTLLNFVKSCLILSDIDFYQFNYCLLPQSAPSWILSRAENLASSSLQDGATKWYYYCQEPVVFIFEVVFIF